MSYDCKLSLDYKILKKNIKEKYQRKIWDTHFYLLTLCDFIVKNNALNNLLLMILTLNIKIIYL